MMGAAANLARQYATKRYRSNCINWGMTPFLTQTPEAFSLGDYLFIPDVRNAVLENREEINAYVIRPEGDVTQITLSTGPLTETERRILADGCLINYYRDSKEE
ncbi:MAG: hypothetical protein IKT07_01725 [Oscillospiraceae bacterium]|nr:hypothetical protein [Oscillospiraceae bacterium]